MEQIPVRHISATQKEPALSGSFHIRDLGTLLSDKDMVQPFHRHSFYYILILKKGMGGHNIDFTSYPVANNTIFFMRPGQVHELSLQKGSTGYLIQFDSDFYSPLEKWAQQVFQKVSNMNFYLLDTERLEKLLPVLNDILQEYEEQQERYHEAIQSGLDLFFLRLLRESRHLVFRSDNASNYMQECLEAFMEQVMLHFPAHKEVAYYARALSLTAYQLNTITKKTVGKTASEIIRDYIILEAKRHLLATSGQVSQIAWQLGYEDVSYFIRFFRKHTGYAPEAFRHTLK